MLYYSSICMKTKKEAFVSFSITEKKKKGTRTNSYYFAI